MEHFSLAVRSCSQTMLEPTGWFRKALEPLLRAPERVLVHRNASSPWTCSPATSQKTRFSGGYDVHPLPALKAALDVQEWRIDHPLYTCAMMPRGAKGFQATLQRRYGKKKSEALEMQY